MLAKYSSKRNFGLTAEPSGKGDTEQSRGDCLRFVVQKHAASRLHYDFRLELDGVLKSWAVPKGPSLDPHVRRLAIMVEDHPLGYAGFEGQIPKGEYGGGEVIVWDSGTYEPLVHDAPVAPRSAQNAMRKGLRDGKIVFELHGAKLDGAWALVRISGKDSEWLLIKKSDEYADASRDILDCDNSTLSGRTIEDIKQGKAPQSRRSGAGLSVGKPNIPDSGKTRHSELEGEPGSLPGAVKLPREQFTLTPMLAKLADAPFDNPDWRFEPKLDGMRILASIYHSGNKKSTRVNLTSRNGLDSTQVYPGLIESLRDSQSHDMILDGEIIATDERGAPSFQRLQQRINLTRKSDIDRADASNPVVYYVFDMLYIDGYDITGTPLRERLELLSSVLVETPAVRLIAGSTGEGTLAYRIAIQQGFEGIIAKRLDSTYDSGRRAGTWLKVKSTLSDDFVIGGYTLGTGKRSDTFGSLLIGQYESKSSVHGALISCGHVGTGFDNALLESLYQKLDAIRTARCPFKSVPKTNTKPTWVKPELSAEIKFASRTADNQLRAPVFMRLRDDKPAKEAVVQKPIHAPVHSKKLISTPYNEAQGAIDELRAANDQATVHLELGEVNLTHLDKVLWPSHNRRPAITKRDLAIYLLRMAPFLLSFLKDRPITLVRYPDGIGGKHFFQRHWPHELPSFLETVKAFSEDNEHDVEFLMCNNTPSLLWLGQIANLEIHAWFARISAAEDRLPTKFTGSAKVIESSVLNYPDFIVFDLDPYIYSGTEKAGDEPEYNAKAFRATGEIAQLMKERLEGLGLKPFLKTSGKTGLHIYVPIVRNYTFDVTRAACEAICRYVENERPEDVTLEWSTAKRTGKVFLDYNMNARSKTIASVYSTRISADAGVSTPITWDELDSIEPADLNINTVPDRVNKIGDLWAGILEAKQDLGALVNQEPAS